MAKWKVSQEHAITKNIILRVWKNEPLKKKNSAIVRMLLLCNIVMNILTEERTTGGRKRKKEVRNSAGAQLIQIRNTKLCSCLPQ